MKGIGREGTCKKGCCWTPSSVCAKSGDCACHFTDELYRLLAKESRKQREMSHADEINDRRTGDEY